MTYSNQLIGNKHFHNQASSNEIGNPTNSFCYQCDEEIKLDERIVQTNGKCYHVRCFVCAQCFLPFGDGEYFQFEGRNYCRHDFGVLFAPSCAICDSHIYGRVIKALGRNWHAECFKCNTCGTSLSEGSFVKAYGKPMCHECNRKEKSLGAGLHTCHRCKCDIEEGQQLNWKSEVYHAYHFSCKLCSSELSSEAREKDGDLVCARCFDKSGIAICSACRRPIEGRVIHAVGKTWHVEHFVCNRCEKPFLGSKYMEKNGQAYCPIHYEQLFAKRCYQCNKAISGDVVCVLNKIYCTQHSACSCCNNLIDRKTKFHEIDLKPVCKSCYELLPLELRRRLAKLQK